MINHRSALLTFPNFGISPWSWLLLLLAGSYLVWFWFNPYGFEPAPDWWREGDYRDYINFSPARTAGYPVFLDLAALAFGTLDAAFDAVRDKQTYLEALASGALDAALKVQLVLYVATVALLGWNMLHIWRAPLLSCSAVLALFAVNILWIWHSYIQSEALMLPLLVLLTGVLIPLLHRPTVGLMCLASLLCGLIIVVRPAAASLLAIWPLALWFVWRRHPARRSARLLIAALAPLALCLVAEALIWRVYHPEPESRPSAVSWQLAAKALMMDTEPMLRDQQIQDFLAMARPALTGERALAHDAALPWKLRMRFRNMFELEAPLATKIYRPTLVEMASQRGVSRSRFERQVGLAALLAAPGEWLANAWSNYLGLWSNIDIYGQDLEPHLDAYLANAGPAAAHEAVVNTVARSSFVLADPEPRWLVLLNLVVTTALFLASLIALGLAAWQWMRRGAAKVEGNLAVAAFCALMVHGYFLVTAILVVVLMRYTVAMWPFQVLCALLLLHWGLTRIFNRRCGNRAVFSPLAHARD